MINKIFLTLLIFSIAEISSLGANLAFGAENNLTEKSQQAEEKLKSIDSKIKRANTAIKKLSNKLKNHDKELNLINKQENKLRSELTSELNELEKNTLNIARIERSPLQYIGITNNTQNRRQNISNQIKKEVSQGIDKSRKEISSLQHIYQRKNKSTQRIANSRENLLSKRKYLTSLFDKQLKVLKASDSQKASLIKKSHKMARFEKIDDIFKFNNQAKNNKGLRSSLETTQYRKLPVTGEVIRSYGRKDKVGIRSKGVTIESSKLANVKSLRDGRVIYNGEFRGYGNIIILEHNNSYHSLYSGLAKDDSISIGDFIRAGNLVGNLPNEETPTLYIEVRKSGKAINPKRWLNN